MKIARTHLPKVSLALAIVAALAAVGAVGDTAAGAAPSHPEIRVGIFPTGIAVNPASDTIYVGNGTSGTLSLIDGKTCNAGDAHGCKRHVTAVTAGIDPIGIAVERSTNTIYVANFSGTVAVVNGRRCNSAHTGGCRLIPATVRVGAGPQFLDVDAKTHTVYVANGGANTVSVIDGRACHAGSTGGCKRLQATVPVGASPFTVAVNAATSSVYVTNFGAHTVSVIDGRTCNAADASGCGKRPITVDVGEAPGGIAVNTRTNTIYVTGEASNDVSVIDGKTCNASRATGCRKAPAHVRAGAGARGLAVNEATDTIYVANTAANTVSVINGATCNGTVQTNCRAAVARVGVSPRRIAVDELTNTVYITNAGSGTVTMLNGRTCNGRVHTGC